MIIGTNYRVGIDPGLVRIIKQLFLSRKEPNDNTKVRPKEDQKSNFYRDIDLISDYPAKWN